MNQKNKKEEKMIPLEQVLQDMQYGSGVESAAEDYYYLHYATDEEKAEIDRRRKIESVVSKIVAVVTIAIVVYLIVKEVII